MHQCAEMDNPLQVRHHLSCIKIDTHNMTLTWPLDKWLHLQQCITAIMESFHAGSFVPCKLLVQALGLLHNSCFVLPLGLLYPYSCNRWSMTKSKKPCKLPLSLQQAMHLLGFGLCLPNCGHHCNLNDLSILPKVSTHHSHMCYQPISLLIPCPIQSSFLSVHLLKNWVGGSLPIQHHVANH